MDMDNHFTAKRSVFVLRCSIKEAVPDESIHDGLWWTLDLIGRTGIQAQQCQDDDRLSRAVLSPHPQLCPQFQLSRRIFIRTLSEGSTPVIIAINKNNTKDGIQGHGQHTG